MQVTHGMVSGLFGSATKTIEEQTVMQFEPLESAVCAPGTHP